MGLPMVSCICITRNRRFYLRRAVKYFQRASELYDGPSELVVVDGSPEPNQEWVSSSRYIHLPEPPKKTVEETRIGHYTNVACDKSQGDIIVKWDDDDWHASTRIMNQVKALHPFDEAIAFAAGIYWYHLLEKMACRGHGAGGGTLAFHKKVWKDNPFVERGVEDTPFCHQNQVRGVPFVDMTGIPYYIYIRHPGNTSPNTSYGFTQKDTDECRAILANTGDLEFYDEISEILPLSPWNHPNAPGSKVHVMNPLMQTWARHHR